MPYYYISVVNSSYAANFHYTGTTWVVQQI